MWEGSAFLGVYRLYNSIYCLHKIQLQNRIRCLWLIKQIKLVYRVNKKNFVALIYFLLIGATGIIPHHFGCFVVQSEIHFLGRLSHPNLVKLMGYCYEDKELLLVYEFMQKGSLENHLFGSRHLLK